jgi:hypothetical protein
MLIIACEAIVVSSASSFGAIESNLTMYCKLLPNLVLKPSQAGNQWLGLAPKPLIAGKPRLQATAMPSHTVATLATVIQIRSNDGNQDLMWLQICSNVGGK